MKTSFTGPIRPSFTGPDGSPKALATGISWESSRPGRSYRPDPPITPKVHSGFTMWGSARTHADRPVETNVFAVEIAVFDHRQDERSVFLWMAEPHGKGNDRCQAFARRLRQAGEKRRIENARQDRVHADALAQEVAGNRQGHSDH